MDLKSIIIILVTGIVSGVSSYLLGRSKNMAETESIKIKTLREIIDAQNSYIDKLEKRMSKLEADKDQQELEILELKADIDTLKKEVVKQCSVCEHKT